MINNQKYKISTMAKDLNMKSKDLLDIFTKLGMTERKHSSVVENEEFNIVMEVLSFEKQVKNFDDYMSGAVTIKRKPEPKPEVKEEPPVSKTGKTVEAPKEEKKPESKKAEAKDSSEKKKANETQPAKVKASDERRPDNRPAPKNPASRFEKKPDFNQQKEKKNKDIRKSAQIQQPRPAFQMGAKVEKSGIIISENESRKDKGC